MCKLNSNDSISSVNSILSRTSFVTLTVASAVFSLFVLFSSVAAAFSVQQIGLLQSLYYLFGNNSVMAVNLIVGLLVFFDFALLTVAMTVTHLAAVHGNTAKTTKGLTLILASLIYMVILAGCLVIFSLSSISVTYYQSVLKDSTSKYTYYYDIATSRFFVYVLFGAGAITLIISLIRLVLSMRRASIGEMLTAKGSALTLISSIYCASLTGISFIVNLCRLVIPDNSNIENFEKVNFNPSILLLLMLNVIMSAAMVIILIDIPVITSLYTSVVNKFNRSNSNNIYTPYATNVYNQAPNRTPYTNPVKPQPYIPYGQPYAPRQAHNPTNNNYQPQQNQPQQPTQPVQNSVNEQTPSSDNGSHTDDNSLNLEK